MGTTGVVMEALHGGGYTYARVDFDGGERWIAGPPIPLAVGDTVSVPDMMNMGGFRSESLGRHFDELFFTGGFHRAGQDLGPVEASFQHEGSVEEIIAVGSYVYLLVDTGVENLWIAAPATEIEEGARVGWNGGSLMRNFSSPSLGRTFSEILFVAAVSVLD
jgi:hypothetical protein